MHTNNTDEKSFEIHRNAIVVEGHSDIMVDVMRRHRLGEKDIIRNVYLPRLKDGGVNFSVLVVGGDHPSFVSGTEYPVHMFSAFQIIDRLVEECEKSSGEFFIVRDKSDLDRHDGIGMILHIEGARPLAGSLSILRTFYRLGLRIMGFAWSWRNEVADGTAEKNSSGLSHFGVELVREMNRLKILIDLSHISDACFYHVLNESEAPVIATHSNARALHNHPRNLSDDMIRKLAEKGGVMGLCFFPHFVSSKENVTVDDIVDHVDYIKKLVGIDHVALGPDFLDYRIWAFKDVIGSFASVQEGGAQTSKDLESYFRYPEGVENVTKLPNFTKAMLRRGYSEEDIIKVLGNNLIRIYKQVWK